MRILAGLVLAALVLFAAALAALAIALPRYVKSEAVRARVESGAEEALEREVRYADLDVGFFPLSLVVLGPRVAGPTPQAPPALEADEIELRVALAPLLDRTVVIDSLVTRGAKLRLVAARRASRCRCPRARRTRGRSPSSRPEASRSRSVKSSCPTRSCSSRIAPSRPP